MTWGTIYEMERGMWANPEEKSRLLREIDELKAEIKRLKSPALEEYRRQYRKDFPDG